MNKLAFMSFAVVFWISLPVILGFLGIGGSDNLRLNFQELNDLKEPTIKSNIELGWTMATYYFKIIFMWVYGAPLIINLFLWILRIITAFVILLIIRGTN